MKVPHSGADWEGKVQSNTIANLPYRVPTLPPKHILLVDDIFTTGATLLSCMRTISENISDIRFTILTLGLTKS